MIEIKNLYKNFGDLNVLSDINLSVRNGEIYGLVGRSGAGKSTLLRCINGLESFDSGTLIVNDTQIAKLDRLGLRKFRKNIGMIFQQPSVLDRKSVYENVIFPMQCWGFGKDERDAKARELIKLVDLEDKTDVKAQSLSGGQKQRVAIARALTLGPGILLCDEATSALDPNTTKNILALLRKINEQMGITIVVVTHEMEVVREICTDVAILEHGKIVQNGDPSVVFMSESPALNRLLGDNPYVLDQDEDKINLEIVSIIATPSAAILSKLASDLNLKFDVADGRIEHFRTRSFTKFVISFSKERLDEVQNYLSVQKIEFKILNGGRL